jgi:pimeloyl-ACP methyl ester carboxylesterase
MKLILIFLILLSGPMNIYSQTPKKTGTITVNNSKVYYEIYGNGEPLFLLHGFTRSSKDWLPYVSAYENDFEVYLVDLKGHGRSSPFTERISLKSVASEVDALVDYLKLGHINAIGYSYGGEVLIQLALLNPGLIRSMVIVGSCGSWDAREFPEFVEYLSYKNIDNLPWMREQQNSEEQIRSILEQVPNYSIKISDEEMKSIRARTLFVMGDQDEATSLECIARARKNLQNSFLWVLPNTGHWAHREPAKDEFVRISKDFLSRDWSE